ncbi:hypothetical protein TrVE_jg10594 [Triparma verrucosa]|uniref:Uncharacterized protein n=1 Tax=Triparma verrucosa TaxID=1606542 RepID=A0A9W7CB55_9STRA|nr:hypothetical protein TrVE_jg10594 [Triparma verrucosa]
MSSLSTSSIPPVPSSVRPISFSSSNNSLTIPTDNSIKTVPTPNIDTQALILASNVLTAELETLPHLLPPSTTSLFHLSSTPSSSTSTLRALLSNHYLPNFTTLPPPSLLSSIMNHITTLPSPFDYTFTTLPPHILTTNDLSNVIPTLPELMLYSHSLCYDCSVIFRLLKFPESYIERYNFGGYIDERVVVRLVNEYGTWVKTLLETRKGGGKDWCLDYICTGKVEGGDEYQRNKRVGESVKRKLGGIEVGVVGVLGEGVESIVGECLKIRALQVLKEQDKFEGLVLDVLEVASRLPSSLEKLSLILSLGEISPSIRPSLSSYLIEGSLISVSDLKHCVETLPSITLDLIKEILPLCGNDDEGIVMKVTCCELASIAGDPSVFEEMVGKAVEGFRGCILGEEGEREVEVALRFCKTVEDLGGRLKTLPSWKILLSWMTLTTSLATKSDISNDVIDTCIQDCYDRRLPNTIDLWKKIEGGGVESVNLIVKVGIREGISKRHPSQIQSWAALKERIKATDDKIPSDELGKRVKLGWSVKVHTSSIVHIDPEVLIRHILESGDSPRLKRRVKKTETGGFILSWLSRKVDKKYAFDMQADVVHETTGDTIVALSSIEDEASGDSTRVLLDGHLVLSSAEFGQTNLIISADVTILSDNNSFTNRRTLDDIAKVVGDFVDVFADKFRDEDLIDERMYSKFISTIDDAEPLTDEESRAIERGLKLVDFLKNAKRVPGSINGTVEKFTLWAEGEVAVHGKSVAVIDVSARRMFAELWFHKSYFQKRKYLGDDLPRFEVQNIDGTRALQYFNSVKFPPPFQPRYFNNWFTWEHRTMVNGGDMFIIAFEPMNTYTGAHQRIPPTDKMKEGETNGVLIVKEISKNICEWTRIQVVNIGVKLPKKVDYGSNVMKLRGLTRGWWQFEDLPNKGNVKQCRATFISYMDPNGIVPTRIVNSLIPDHLSSLTLVADNFQKDKLVDLVDGQVLETIVRTRWDQEIYTDQENKIISNGISFLQSVKDSSDWLKIQNETEGIGEHQNTSVNDIRWQLAHLDGDKLATGIVEAVIDAPIEKVVVWEFLKTSRESTREHLKKNGLAKVTKVINNHSLYYLNVRDLKVPGLLHREFRSKSVWKRVGQNKIYVVYEDTKDLDVEHPHDSRINHVGSARTTWEYERLEDNEGIPQTKVTLASRFDLGGSIPTFIMTKLAKKVVRNVAMMMTKFEQGATMDERRRRRLVDKIKEMLHEGGPEVASVLRRFDEISKVKSGSEEPANGFGSAFSLVQVSSRGGKGWGSTSIEVEADIEEVAAFLWDFDSRANMQISGDIERRVLRDSVDNNFFKRVVMRRKRLKSSHHGQHSIRRFTNRMTLHKLDADTFVLLLTPIDDNTLKKDPRRKSSAVDLNALVVKGRAEEVFRLKKTGRRRLTKVDFALNLETGHNRSVSRRATKVAVEQLLGEVAEIAIYFEMLKPLEDYDAKCGEDLGHALLWKASSSRKRLERLEVMMKGKALAAFAEKYPWYPLFMKQVVSGKLSLGKPIKTKLVCLTDLEAKQIGKNLIPALRSKKLAEAGVDQWKVQNNAVKELMEKYVWFYPMILVVSKGIVKSAAWGLMWRVVVGAVLSMTDMGTDLLVLKQFWEGGENMKTYRDLTLGSLIASFGLQLFISIFQNHKLGVLKIIRESLYVLLGMKAAVDAYRVAIGAKKEKGSVFPPMLELSFGKGIELFSESIPGIIIQLSAILSSLSSNVSVSGLSLTSLGISALTTGFVSAQISYDFDTNPANRAQNVDFYGYVPDNPKKRTIVFVMMTIMASTMVMIRGFALVMIGQLSMQYLTIFLSIDMGLFLLSKLLRDDFIYWIPVDNRIFEFVLSLMMRLIIKIITDFTGCVQFRHPNELGGIYFAFNNVITVLALFAALHLTESQGDIAAENMTKLKEVAGYLLGLELLSFFIFLANINHDHVKTFFSTESGSHFTCRTFLENSDDAIKGHAVLSNSQNQWKSIRGEVQRWLEAGWDTWTEEHPRWFIEHKDLIPADLRPVRLDGSLSMLTQSRRTTTHVRMTKDKKNKVSPEGEEIKLMNTRRGSSDFGRELKRRGSFME